MNQFEQVVFTWAPRGQTDTHDWKHYLAVNSLAGGNNRANLGVGSFCSNLPSVPINLVWVMGSYIYMILLLNATST